MENWIWHLGVGNRPLLQVVAGGCRWLQVAAGGCRWLVVKKGMASGRRTFVIVIMRMGAIA